MLLTIERATLLGALDHIGSIVEKRNTIPILSNILIEVKGGRMTVAATDLDIHVEETVDASVSEGGKVTVPSHHFREIIKKMPDGSQVKISTVKGDGGRLKIEAGRSKFEVNTLPWEDFPHMTMGDMPCTFTIPASSLKKMIAAIKWSMSQEETRYYLNGFYLHAKDKLLVAVSTDGHRLTRYQTDIPDGAEKIPGIIIPRKTAGELFRMLDGVEGDVEFAASATKIELTFGGMTLRSKLIDGNFPPYERVIPSGNCNILTANVKDIAGAVDRVSTLNADRTRAVKLELRQDGVTFSAVNPESGTATEDMDAELAGKDMEIGFNGRYLGALMAQIGTPSARFLFGDAGSPVLAEPIGDSSALYVLMPVRC